MRDRASHGSHPLPGTGLALRQQWSIATLPEFCTRALAKGYAWWQVRDEPPPCPRGGELQFELKPPAMPGGSRAPALHPGSITAGSGTQKGTKPGAEMCFSAFAAHLWLYPVVSTAS